MRTMIRIRIPVGPGNKSVKDGSLPKTLGEALDRFKPEAAYFFTDQGLRTTLLVIDMKDAAEMPRIAETFFQAFDASVEFFPVMNADDLKKGVSQL
jgi:hypothetical protein